MDELILELKRQGVLKSPHVEAAFQAIDRKDFVLPKYEGEAYENHPLPIGSGQTISQPYTVAFMLDLLDPRPGETILDVGAGSGWQTALLASIVSQKEKRGRSSKKGAVYAEERIPKLCAFARVNISKYNFIRSGAVKLSCADATAELPSRIRFNKIIAAAAAHDAIPEIWQERLAEGGFIVAPIGNSIWRYTKISESEWQEEAFPGFSFVPLVEDPPENKNNPDSLPSKESTLSARKNPPGVLIAVVAAALAYGAWAAFAPVNAPAGGVHVAISQGSGSRAIGGILKEKGLIRSKWVFVTYAALRGKASSLKPGEYDFEGPLAIPNLVSQLVRGERYPNERVITIPEGWDLRDIAEYFSSKGMYASEEWWNAAGSPAADYRISSRLRKPDTFAKEFPFLADKPPSVGLEGYLYPDTYRVFRDSPPGDTVRKMLENFNAKVTPDLREEITRQKKTLFSVITVASLIEKETSNPNDRKIVSGIIWKRLKLGLPLQIDASVNYVTGKRETPDAEDLAADSPFNTYRHPGLPLGPIANPGIDAIRAAIYPAASDYLYYLSTTEGKTIFSRTFDEHRTARAKYLKR